jgi:hypothetical protein
LSVIRHFFLILISVFSLISVASANLSPEKSTYLSQTPLLDNFEISEKRDITLQKISDPSLQGIFICKPLTHIGKMVYCVEIASGFSYYAYGNPTVWVDPTGNYSQETIFEKGQEAYESGNKIQAGAWAWYSAVHSYFNDFSGGSLNDSELALEGRISGEELKNRQIEKAKNYAGNVAKRGVVGGALYVGKSFVCSKARVVCDGIGSAVNKAGGFLNRDVRSFGKKKQNKTHTTEESRNGNNYNGIAQKSFGKTSRSSNYSISSNKSRKDYLNNKFGRTGDINQDIAIRGRKETASNFYKKSGFSEEDIPSHLTGIDFTKQVEVVKINKGKRLYQFQTNGAPQGNYYSFNKNTTPTQIGISPSGFNRSLKVMEPKIQTQRFTNQKVDVLKSTASRVKDFWSVQGQTYQTTGGGGQLFSSQKDAFPLMIK